MKQTKTCSPPKLFFFFLNSKRTRMLPNDPQGLVSTLTSIATTFFGMEFGKIIVNNKGKPASILGKSVALSSCLLVVGLTLSLWMPINKKIWTVPFCTLQGGISGLALAFSYYIIDLADQDRKMLITRVFRDYLIRPLIWIGTNPLLIFIGMVSLEILLLDTVQVFYKVSRKKLSTKEGSVSNGEGGGKQ